MEPILLHYTFIVELLLVPLPAVSLYTRDHDCILFEAREKRLLGSLRRRRIILRLADALIVMDSRLVIRVGNMVTTSSLEALGVDLNGTTSNPLWILFADFTFFASRCLIMSIL